MIIALQCPQCFGDIQLDDDREFGFCCMCGTKIMLSETEGHLERKKYNNFKRRAEMEFELMNYENALEWYEKALAIDSNEYRVLFDAELCRYLCDSEPLESVDAEKIERFRKIYMLCVKNDSVESNITHYKDEFSSCISDLAEIVSVRNCEEIYETISTFLGMHMMNDLMIAIIQKNALVNDFEKMQRYYNSHEKGRYEKVSALYENIIRREELERKKFLYVACVEIKNGNEVVGYLQLTPLYLRFEYLSGLVLRFEYTSIKKDSVVFDGESLLFEYQEKKIRLYSRELKYFSEYIKQRLDRKHIKLNEEKLLDIDFYIANQYRNNKEMAIYTYMIYGGLCEDEAEYRFQKNIIT